MDNTIPATDHTQETSVALLIIFFPLLIHASTAEVREVIEMGFLTRQLMQIPRDGQGEIFFVITFILSTKCIWNTSRVLTLGN